MKYNEIKLTFINSYLHGLNRWGIVDYFSYQGCEFAPGTFNLLLSRESNIIFILTYSLICQKSIISCHSIAEIRWIYVDPSSQCIFQKKVALYYSQYKCCVYFIYMYAYICMLTITVFICIKLLVIKCLLMLILIYMQLQCSEHCKVLRAQHIYIYTYPLA